MERTDQTLTKLRQMIASGSFDDEGRMPPERALAEELGVGRRSLRRALDILEQEGRISRHQGRGTFVQTNGNGSGNGHARTIARLASALLPGRIAGCAEPGLRDTFSTIPIRWK